MGREWIPATVQASTRECIWVVCGAGALDAATLALRMLVGTRPLLSETGTVVAICAALLVTVILLWFEFGSTDCGNRAGSSLPGVLQLHVRTDLG